MKKIGKRLEIIFTVTDIEEIFSINNNNFKKSDQSWKKKKKRLQKKNSWNLLYQGLIQLQKTKQGKEWLELDGSLFLPHIEKTDRDRSCQCGTVWWSLCLKRSSGSCGTGGSGVLVGIMCRIGGWKGPAWRPHMMLSLTSHWPENSHILEMSSF